jgi:phosphatidylglycerophosphatase A
MNNIRPVVQQRNPKTEYSFSRIMATVFFVGKIPFAPGTFGSLAGLLVFVVLSCFTRSLPLQVLFAAVLFFAGVYFSGKTALQDGKKDPPHIVIDEAAGIFTALLFVPRADALSLAAVFILFRLLDITKIYPIGRLEDLPGGWGIMADDLAAGIISGIIFLSGSVLLRA